MRPLRWFASILAVLALALLPALSAEAPLLGAREWTVGQLALEAVRAATAKPKPGQLSLRDIIHQAQSLQREFGGTNPSPTTQRALALAALVPLAAIVAGVCAILSLLWLVLEQIHPRGSTAEGSACGFDIRKKRERLPEARYTNASFALKWRRAYCANAIVGLAASAYAIVASRMLNAAAQAQVARAQHSLSSLLGRLGLHASAQVQIAVGVAPEIGLYVLGGLFIAMLVIPARDARV
ncbi:MAG: hypothetical protein ACRD1C_07200 [Terriglobales bacterium]